MRLSTQCMCCIVRMQEKKMSDSLIAEESKAAYLKEVFRAIGESEENCSAPLMVSRINKIQERYFGAPLDYTKIKQKYNELMESLADQVEEKIRCNEDPLAAAILYARAGNYIDFGALETVEEEKMLEILDKAAGDDLTKNTYLQFREDLKNAGELVYLLDNCGEIVMDKLLVRELKRQYPKLHITVIVRGMPVLNDVTMEDAIATGMVLEADVIGNGTDIAGTELSVIGEAAKNAIEKADMLLSKGQGNFETLKGCGLNVYYLFLCKCQMFAERFGMERFKGVFLNEKEIGS